MFALVDCNNFYASCERVFNPSWKGKPIVVLSNNDGCIIARSNEAKQLGIPMGAPFFKWKDFLWGHNVIACSSNYTLYGDMSQRVMKTLEAFSPNIQVYSIDEAFLKLSGTDLYEYGKTIRKTVFRWTGIPVSIGIASTKTLAKVANHQAKNNPAKEGVAVLDTHEEIEAILDTLPVTEIWGIGKRQGIKLNKLGIFTTKEFRDADDTRIKKNLTVVGHRISLELRGLSCLPLEEIPPPKQSVTCSRSFSQRIGSLESLHEAVATYTAKAAEKIRRQHTLASLMIIFLQRDSHHEGESNFENIRVVFPEPTHYTPHLIHYAKKAITALFHQGDCYRKAGIILDGLIPETHYQPSLFAPKEFNFQKKQLLMKTVDRLNKNFGRNVIHSAAEGIKKPWQMKQQLKTNKLTTCWEELLTIQI